MKMQNLHRRPKQGVLHTGIDHIWLESLDDKRKDLLKVSTKDNRKATKGSIGIVNVLEDVVDSLMDVMMLHRCFIPYNQISVVNEISQL